MTLIEPGSHPPAQVPEHFIQEVRNLIVAFGDIGVKIAAILRFGGPFGGHSENDGWEYPANSDAYAD